MLHRRYRACLAIGAATQEIEPHMLEIARQPIDQQAFPRVGWRHVLCGLLRPVQAQLGTKLIKCFGQDFR